MAIAISLHNIPEGISISVPIYYATKNRFRAIGYTLISALSEPLGALITFLFLKKYINDMVLGILFGVIAGIMMEISLRKLLPTSKSYRMPKITVIYFIIGILFMLVKFIIN